MMPKDVSFEGDVILNGTTNLNLTIHIPGLYYALMAFGFVLGLILGAVL
jgi:hypothetical protein